VELVVGNASVRRIASGKVLPFGILHALPLSYSPCGKAGIEPAAVQSLITDRHRPEAKFPPQESHLRIDAGVAE
jgi:hypothetical protein